MRSRSFSVVIPPTTANPNAYDSLDEDYLEHTWEEILSDESSFNSSFDYYSGNETVDGTSISTDGPLRKDLGHAKSPYFATSKSSEKRTVSNGQTMEIDSESDDTSNTLGSVSSERLIKALEIDHLLDEMEARAFARVDADTHEHLVRYIAERPFFKSDEYPVKRSERREFVNGIRKATMDAGLDEVTKENIIAYVKRLYLAACGRGHIYDSGSEYGEEIDDKPAGSSHLEPVSVCDFREERRKRKNGRSRKARKDSSADNLRDPAIGTQKHSQSISAVAPEKSKPVTAANTSTDAYDFFDLDF